jgi:hypothetical protein
VVGPSYECVDQIYSNLTDMVASQYSIPTNSNLDYLNGYLFIAGENDTISIYDQFYRFEMQYRNGNSPYINLSCTAYESSYTLNVSYLNGLQTVKAQVHPGLVLNSTYAYSDDAILNWNATTLNDSTLVLGHNNLTVVDVFKRVNLIAVKDTLVLAMSGLIPFPSMY